MELTDYQRKAIQKLGESIHDGKWDEEGLVKLLELTGTFLNLQTIPNYARTHGMSYNGVKKTRRLLKLFNQTFVADCK